MLTRSVSIWLVLLVALGLVTAPAIMADDGQGASSNESTTLTTIRTIDSDAPAKPASTEPAPAETPAETPTLAEPVAIGPAPTVAPTPLPAALRARAAESKKLPGAVGPRKDDREPTLQIVEQGSAFEDPAEKLQPVPDAAAEGKAEIETASFKAVTPGETKLAQLQEAWGTPSQMAKQDGQPVYLYSIEPFDRIEVSVEGDTVASIVIRLQHAVAAKPLAEQLKLTNIRPVLVSNELGEILGQSFPERGVLFSFEAADVAGKATMRVVDVILEPVSAEAFVLRAETYLDSRLTESAEDLNNAIELQPELARAHWLQARVAATLGDAAMAMSASSQAIRLEPANAQFLVTRAQILGQAGKFAEAIREVEAAVANAEKRPHIKARALCLLGDLIGSQPEADYSKALESHMAAIPVADPLVASPHPAIRLVAMEVLIDAHLGAAHDIAWGHWNNKKVTVSTWLGRASAFAENMIESESGGPPLRFRVATRALACCVGARGELDPGQWIETALVTGEEMIDGTDDSLQKDRIAWDLGLALYDGVQVYQMRDEQQFALGTGAKAIEFLTSVPVDDTTAADAHVLARLYFRLGTIHAVSKLDHDQAVTWFDKAVPLFQKATDDVASHEVGRLGETLVSMGVSYWEVGNRELGLDLTKTGVELVEAAAAEGYVDKTVLEVPYSNLATMHRQLGEVDEANRYLRMASENRPALR